MKLNIEIKITVKNIGDENQLQITTNESTKLNDVLVTLKMAERQLQSQMQEAFKKTNQNATEWFTTVTLKEIYDETN
jgi:hypothetical protein